MNYIHCAVCRKPYERSDEVALDLLYTVLHKNCPEEQKFRHLEIIDEGTFEEIVKRHFDQSRLS